ncbi:Phosphoserine aminotransferase [Zancudomyces culisetae]|uniref:phosphoserine transaminase n=1 Tax=Zancudomyces culisetae TaxID=1213189 RepID=A0A1R1PXN4_ZANCU|nr:Phosphoserine aminotransferase [Zancudomyces culisetae]|eukprot:OMH85667.1 Phosphoserine aminotransferase [Zancudomyces culisetae]
MNKNRAVNFSAGPSMMPYPVLLKARDEFLDYQDSGMSVIELSHRSKLFGDVITGAEQKLRKLLNIPSEGYSVFFMHGGGTGGFAATYLNLMSSKVVRDKQRKIHNQGKTLKCGYVVSGIWSKSAYEECVDLGGNAHVVVNCESTVELDNASDAGVPQIKKGYFDLPPTEKWDLPPSDELAYIYYCDNETIGGFEMNVDSITSAVDTNEVVLVCDVSSNILTRKFDVSKFGIIYGGVQKNIGPSGATVVIIRNDLLVRDSPENQPAGSPTLPPPPGIPSVLSYYYFSSKGPMPHTPSTFSIYICNLVFDYILENGGIDGMEQLSEKKSSLIYDFVDSNPSIFFAPVCKRYRSRMNVVFNFKNQALDTLFVNEAKSYNIFEINGHRSVGGIRVSVYNAVTVDDVLYFLEFAKKFIAKHCKN